MKPELIKENVGCYPLSGIRIHLYKCGFCGNEFRTTAGNVNHGITKSCGCLKANKSRARKERLDAKQKAGRKPGSGRPKKAYEPRDENSPKLIRDSGTWKEKSTFACGYCGKEFEAFVTALRRKESQSCGCRRKIDFPSHNKTHGKTGTRLFKIWTGMRNRCNPDRKCGTKNYADRGISVCNEWESYQAFEDWAASNGYAEGLSIDRIDVNGDYCPENCRWVTPQHQARNRRNTRWNLEMTRVVRKLKEAGFSAREILNVWGFPLSIRSDIDRICKFKRWKPLDL